jgi:N-acetylneuraminic acid mutarotase
MTPGLRIMTLMLPVSAGLVGCHPHTGRETIDWTWGPVLPRAQSAFGTAATSDSIITVGGTFWKQEGDGPPVKQWLTSVMECNPDDGHWAELPDYPIPIGYPMTVVVNERLYAIGGMNADGPVTDCRILDLAHREAGWTTGPDLPLPLGRLRGDAIDSVIYAVSGPESAAATGEFIHLPAVYALDTGRPAPRWEKIAELPMPDVGYRFATACAGHVFVFGGADPRPDGSLRLLDHAYKLDVRDRQWQPRAPLPRCLRDATATPLDDHRILITGGVERAAEPADTPDGKDRICLSNVCLLYDVNADRYISLPALRLAVADHGLVTWRGRVYTVGGEDSPYRTRTDLVQVGVFP